MYFYVLFVVKILIISQSRFYHLLLISESAWPCTFLYFFGVNNLHTIYYGSKLNVKHKEELPTWVIEKINYLESNETKFLLEKCIYQGGAYYWFNIVESSCPMCELYNSEGRQWNEVSNMDIPEEFTKSGTDIWEIEYHYPSLQDLFHFFGELE